MNFFTVSPNPNPHIVEQFFGQTLFFESMYILYFCVEGIHGISLSQVCVNYKFFVFSKEKTASFYFQE